jgi:hypothetical protein
MLVKEAVEYPNLTMMKHHMRCSCMKLKVIQAPCLMHLVLKRGCYFVLCLAKFFI